MQIGFRVDSSYQIGTGHVMRSLTLAKELKSRGASCIFICSDCEGNIQEVIKNAGFEVRNVNKSTNSDASIQGDNTRQNIFGATKTEYWKSDAEKTKDILKGIMLDWLVVDHYELDIRWEKELRNTCCKLMVIDDLANRKHDCDLLLDQNYYENIITRYKGLLPGKCRLLLGPSYALLREEFVSARQVQRKFNPEIKNIFVFFGGSDPANQTMMALESIVESQLKDITVVVVIGSAYMYKRDLAAFCKKHPHVELHEQINNMAELMINADIAIGAGGATMWERCYLGLPTLTVITAENQAVTTEAVAKHGAIHLLGRHETLNTKKYMCAIQEMTGNPDLLMKMSSIAKELVCVGTGKVANTMMDM